MGLGISHFAGLLTALAYTAFAVVLPARGKRSWPNYLFSAAAMMTALWSLSGVFYDRGWAQAWLPPTLGALRDASWFALCIGLLRHDAHEQPLWRRLAVAAGVVIAVDLAFALSSASIDTGLGVRLNLPTAALAVAIMGLILTENLYRNLGRSRLWSIKLMLIALAALYVYQLALSIPEFLGAAAIEPFQLAQPLVYLVTLPLFVVTAVRGESLRLKLHSSRHVVFHSATLIFAGILLQGTAAAALYVRHFGGTPAVVLSIVLGFAGLVALIVALSTHSVRSQIRKFINENFFSYKYDYRLEWTKFIQALSRYEDRGGPERVLLVISDHLDSPGGVLFVRRAGWKQFARLAYSAFGENFGPLQETDELLKSFVDEAVVYLELTSKEQTPELALWRARFPQVWLAVPLRFRDELVAFALLHKPRAPKKLDWEDKNLIGLIATQLADFLVHEQTAQALADSQQLAEFNNRVTFALHDLKNTAGQLNLLVKNAERFGDDAAFRADMMETIRHAVDNLQRLITRLRDGKGSEAGCAPSRVNICEVVARFAQSKAKAGIVLGRDGTGGVHFAQIAHPELFENALEHIVTNAVEASPEAGSVELGVDRLGARVRVRVRDHGPGMSEEFIARELFRPLHTTKNKGLGIGAYQARAIMRDLGGDIEVDSKPGEGTTVSLLLPTGEQAESRAAS